MNLLELLKTDRIKVPLESADKRGVINELVSKLAESGGLKDEAAVSQAVWAREQTRTTGIGQGLAIPHAKSDACDQLMLAVGKPAEPIEFDSIDHQPVRLVFLLLSPLDRTSEHIQTLAAISRLMSIEAFREAAYETTTAKELLRLFEKYESTRTSASTR
ncbi:MAG: PTS sugar transporter subunit IIA [Planctomycetes bacterium]|nr:PTS sugar transporter subunit IIA [Planctomycetota bacterium]NOG52937.1 PTS sugar transporter subunit IIA [Planctomycetota bacterium]